MWYTIFEPEYIVTHDMFHAIRFLCALCLPHGKKGVPVERNRLAKYAIDQFIHLHDANDTSSYRRHLEAVISLIWSFQENRNFIEERTLKDHIREWHCRKAILSANKYGDIVLNPRQRISFRIRSLKPESAHFQIWIFQREDGTFVLCSVGPDETTYMHDLPLYKDIGKNKTHKRFRAKPQGVMPTLSDALYKIMLTEGIETILNADEEFADERYSAHISPVCKRLENDFNKKHHEFLMYRSDSYYCVHPRGYENGIIVPLANGNGKGKRFFVKVYWESGAGYVFYFVHKHRSGPVLAVKMKKNNRFAYVLARADTITIAREMAASKAFRQRNGMQNLMCLGWEDIHVNERLRQENNTPCLEQKEIIDEVRRVLQKQYSKEEVFLLLSAFNGEEVNEGLAWAHEQLNINVPDLLKNDPVLRDLMS